MNQIIFRRIVMLVVSMAVLTGLLGCAPGTAQDNEQAAVVQSNIPREESVEVPEGQLQELSQGNLGFAVDLYHQLSGDEGNLFFSPYSISLALAMTYAGARGETEVQMADVLHFNLPQEQLHPVFNGLDQILESRSEIELPEQGDPLRLNIANSIWGQSGYTFLQPFLDTLAESYGAGMRLVDYIGDAEQARQDINAWVSEETEGKIEDLIPPGTLNSVTRLVLANAIYFNASWLHPFEEKATGEGAFHLLDGSEVVIPLMYQSEMFGYARGDGFQAVELPYVGGDTSMVLFIPDEGNFSAFESEIDSELLSTGIDMMGVQNVMLTMPRFEYTSEMNLSDKLMAMGMERAFIEADFSGMDGSFDLAISDVLHKAFVSVDEEGTEAAAATAVVMRATAMLDPGVELTIDRPFIYVIRDRETGTILFMGRVLNPASE